ncbi:MAG: hypothetical protein GQ570_07450 [Helicobacteraceae bacterium]|nr:hypothetical protein [Helicobacteraceae bacterium]
MYEFQLPLHSLQGSGLGLYVSKMIIENSMNGTLTVSNVPNGTKFTIVCQ